MEQSGYKAKAHQEESRRMEEKKDQSFKTYLQTVFPRPLSSYLPIAAGIGGASWAGLDLLLAFLAHISFLAAILPSLLLTVFFSFLSGFIGFSRWKSPAQVYNHHNGAENPLLRKMEIVPAEKLEERSEEKAEPLERLSELLKIQTRARYSIQIWQEYKQSVFAILACEIETVADEVKEIFAEKIRYQIAEKELLFLFPQEKVKIAAGEVAFFLEEGKNKEKEYCDIVRYLNRFRADQVWLNNEENKQTLEELKKRKAEVKNQLGKYTEEILKNLEDISRIVLQN